MTAIISYRQSFDHDGTHYTQRIRISKNTFKKLADAINVEIASNFSDKRKYFTSANETIFLKPLDLSKSVVYLTCTQNRFIKFKMGVVFYNKLGLHHNTYLFIDEKMID